MNLSAVFIRRIVMTSVLMAALVLFGGFSFFALPISELPSVDFPTITVNMTLSGANPETMAAAVATPLERQFSGLQGLDSMSSTSSTGSTRIVLQFALDQNVDSAAQDVQNAVSQAAGLLPREINPAEVHKEDPSAAPIMHLALHSTTIALPIRRDASPAPRRTSTRWTPCPSTATRARASPPSARRLPIRVRARRRS